MRELNFGQLLQQRKNQGLYRQRLIHNSPQSPLLNIDNKEYLSFCSNDYLGLANNTIIASQFKSAIDSYGVGSGASHLVSGHHQIHENLEQQLAKFTKRYQALVFANGYMANIAIVTTLLNRGDAVFMDRLNHASMYDAGMMTRASMHRYKHNCMTDLERLLETSAAKNKLIITDAVFSMDGDIAPIEKLTDLAKKHDCLLAIDDAHGFGVLGKQGGGIAELYNCSQQDIPLLMATFGKALGTYGAFIAGSSELIDFFIQHARSYIYTTALPPALAEATIASLAIVKNSQLAREHLYKLIDYFKRGCKSLSLNILESKTAIQPIIIGSSSQAVAISNKLKEVGILVTAIRPPTVAEGTARLRITLSASHSKDQVDRLLKALTKINTEQEINNNAR